MSVKVYRWASVYRGRVSHLIPIEEGRDCRALCGFVQKASTQPGWHQSFGLNPCERCSEEAASRSSEVEIEEE